MRLEKFGFLLIAPLLFFINCSENSNVELTELFPLQDGAEWNYRFTIIEPSYDDTVLFYSDFDMSQISNNSRTAVFELYSIDFNVVVALQSKDNGICMETRPESFSDAKANINSLKISDCAVLLKYPVKNSARYSYTDIVGDKGIKYDVTVSKELFQLNGKSYEVYSYTLANTSGNNDSVNEVVFSPELGIVKIYGEDQGTPFQLMELTSTTLE